MLRPILALLIPLSLFPVPTFADDVKPSKPAEKPKAAAEKDAKGDKQEDGKATKWAHLAVSGEYAEGPELPGLFGGVSESLSEVIERFDEAAEDEKIAGLVLKIEDVSVGWAKLHELRTALARVRKAGKPIYAYADSFDAKSYLLATACDKVFVPESGLVMMVGLRAEISFYKNLFDKVGIEPNMLRVGEYKSAAESYTRTEMSPEFREEMQAIIDGYWEITVSAISEGRKLSAKQIERIVDTGPHTAKASRKLGLVDDLLYEDELEARIEKDHPGTDVTLEKKYGKSKLDTDFEGFAGLAKLMNLMMGIDDTTTSSNKPKIAVIYATGMIMPGDSTSSLFGGSVMGGDTIVKAIRTADDDEKVKAIVLRIDSPGGSALASDLMWRALEKVEKPIVVSMGDTAASGGYYIAMGAKTIFAEPGTITGSIGVVGGKLAMGELWNKVGITTSVVARGENSGILSTTKGFSDSERKAMQAILDDIYEQFVGKAAKGRGMEYEKLEKLARGRIYTGTQALAVGLVDKIGTLDDAVAHARELAGLKEGDDVDRMLLPKPASPFESLFGDLEASASTRSSEAISTAIHTEIERLAPELAQHLRAVELVNLLSQREPRLFVLPYRVEVK